MLSELTNRVPSVDTALVGMVDERKRFLFIHHPACPLLRAEAHTSKNDLGNFQARVSKSWYPVRQQMTRNLERSRLCRETWSTHRAYSIFGRVVMVNSGDCLAL